MKKVQN